MARWYDYIGHKTSSGDETSVAKDWATYNAWRIKGPIVQNGEYIKLRPLNLNSVNTNNILNQTEFIIRLFKLFNIQTRITNVNCLYV